MKYLLSLLLLTTIGCDSIPQSDSTTSLLESIDKHLSDLAPAANSVSEETTDQVKKIIRFEYKVVSLDGSLSADQIQMALQELGDEQWDCFSIMPRGATLMISCKKLPYSALRSIRQLIF